MNATFAIMQLHPTVHHYLWQAELPWSTTTKDHFIPVI